MGCGASVGIDKEKPNGVPQKFGSRHEVIPPIKSDEKTQEAQTQPPSAAPPSSLVPAPPLPAIKNDASKLSNSEKNTMSVEEFKAAFSKGSEDKTETTQTAGQSTKEKNLQSLKELEEKAKALQKILEEKLAAMTQAAAPPSNGTKNELSRKALAGNVEMECPSPAKIVRIFTSSTFTDTMHERNMLMRYAYPKVKAHCRKIGYEFQVVDMRWGVRDEATDDHMGTELCLKELKLCQKLSTGPNFVSLLSHKYGYTAFPRVIEAVEFETLMGAIESKTTLDLFHKWYKKDENMAPTSYILSSISTHIPDFISKTKELRKSAAAQWWEENSAMQAAFDETATKLFGEEKARKYTMSVTETEVREGLLNIEDQEKHCLWLKREIDDIEDQEKSYQLSRYMECLGSEEKWTKARRMLNELKESQMMHKLPNDKILTYHVNWNENGGINPDEDEQHRSYLQRMCDDFVSSMCNMIDQSVAERSSTDEPLVQEIIQHISFCQGKCEMFHGREESLQILEQYVSGTSTQPFMVYGESGSGKTSLMAMTAKMTRQWPRGKTVNVVLRFLGTSPDSSSVIPLLQSVTKQIRRNYSSLRREPSDKLEVLIKEFWLALTLSKPDRPLVLILDSIDQLDSSYDGRLMGWLPPKLPQNTKIIISTLPDAQYECFNAMKARNIGENNMYKVPKLKDQEASDIIDKWLAMKNRRLTDAQKDIVLTAFNQCPTPLYLKMIFDEASTWTSYAAPETTTLPRNVQKCIEKLFDNLEKMHGNILVSKALAYLTLAKNGLSESELEDILSCDDDVLNDVYMYWTPPIRRLPPLLIVRLRTDLSSYLVERGADGSRVIYWYHRQFIEAAKLRYCSQPDKNKLTHSALADFFAGTWSKGRKKPFTSSTGEAGEEDRNVAEQLLTFGENMFNIRSLNNLPFHRLQAEQLDTLKQECLANYPFLHTKIRAVPLIQVLEDFKNTLKKFEDDKLIIGILEALNLSQKALLHDPTQLAAQMIGRLESNEVTAAFLKHCLDYPQPYFQPNRDILTKPGGQLVSCLAGHKNELDCIDMTADGKLVVTACQSDKEIMLWDIERHLLLKTIRGLGQCTATYFCLNDSCIVAEMDQSVRVLDVETGTKKFDIAMAVKDNNCIAVTGENKEILVVFNKKSAYLHDLNKGGQLIQKIDNPTITFGGVSIAAATKNLVAVTDDDQYNIAVLDIRNKSFYPKFRGFEKIYDEEMEDYDEHEVEAMDFTPDESMLVYTNMFTSEVVFADVKTGERKQYIEGDKDYSFRGLKITDDGKFMYIRDSERLKIFDLATLKEIDQLEHPKDVQFAISNDMKIVVTVAEDCNVRIWDRSRKKKDHGEKGRSVNLHSIRQSSDVQSAQNPRYFVAMGQRQKNDEEDNVFVFDVLKDKIVREHALPRLQSSQLLVMPDPKKVLIISSYYGFVVDVDSGKIIRKLETALPKYSRNMLKVTKRNEIVTTTKGQKFLKVIDLNTGKVSCILKSNQTQKIETIQVNDAGTMATAQTEEGPMLIFDIENKNYMYSISNKDYDDYFATSMLVNDRKSHVLFSTDKPIPGLGKTDITQAVVWDVEQRVEVCKLNDKVGQLNLLKSDDITSLDEMFLLDDTKVISHHYDYVIRVFDYLQGTLLHRLAGHTTAIQLSVTPKGPYIFSYGSFSEEDCFKLWDKNTFKCIASYTLDHSVSSASLSSDGKFIIARAHQPADIMRWDIVHGDPSMQYNVDDYSEDFPGEVSGQHLDLEIPETYVADPNDPDSDPEIPSDDDDEDDDDEA